MANAVIVSQSSARRQRSDMDGADAMRRRIESCGDDLADRAQALCWWIQNRTISTHHARSPPTKVLIHRQHIYSKHHSPPHKEHNASPLHFHAHATYSLVIPLASARSGKDRILLIVLPKKVAKEGRHLRTRAHGVTILYLSYPVRATHAANSSRARLRIRRGRNERARLRLG